MPKALSEYNRRRDFTLTKEPPGKSDRAKRAAHALKFVIQKHDASRLHYDFRLELGGTLKSWAIPKGPSLDPKDKRLAVHVEDHPMGYANFEGSIPHGQYGGGDVIVWDQGVWQPHDDPAAAYKSGKLKFTLIGEKLTGDWTLVKTHMRGSDKDQWLLIKEKDESARPASEYDITSDQPHSVITGGLLPLDQGKGPARKTAKTVKPAKASETKSAEKIAKTSIRPAAKKTAKKSSMPEMLTPELATLVSEPPKGDWLYEIKFDGYRIMARVQNGEVKLFTRNGNDWTHRMPQQAEAIAALGLEDSWLDGEVVVPNEQGLPDFQALQNAFDAGRSQNILFYLFDAPFLNGEDLRNTPVEQRRALLEKALPASTKKGPLRFSAAFTANCHESLLNSACDMELEGIIGKRMGSPYVSRRSGDWVKLKCRLRQEFVVVGYSEPQGSRSGFGALLVAVHDKMGSPDLRYAGRVGTGFNEAMLADVFKKLKRLARDTSPLSHKLEAALTRGVHWVEPTLVCELEFAQWTGEGILRQAAFIALRTDKPAKDIIREQAKSPSELPPPEAKTIGKAAGKISAGSTKKSLTKNGDLILADVKITHPERVIDPQTGATKGMLASFYHEISKWALPHLKDRPVSLVRAPEGIGGEQFFQKHAERLAIPHIKQLDRELDPEHQAYMEIDSEQALIGAAQMSTIELHTWGSTSDDIEKPDRIILDLDPDPVLPWRSLVEATRLTLAVLDELKLDSFLKTTGGKGMHIVIPIKQEAEWDYIKEFSRTIAEFMARQIPDRFVAKMGPKNRIGKIFIDYLRNQRGASTVAAYSARARPGLPVSVPIARGELVELTSSNQWTIANLAERLNSLKGDPWAGYKHRQKITLGMWGKLDSKPPA